MPKAQSKASFSFSCSNIRASNSGESHTITSTLPSSLLSLLCWFPVTYIWSIKAPSSLPSHTISLAYSYGSSASIPCIFNKVNTPPAVVDFPQPEPANKFTTIVSLFIIPIPLFCLVKGC